MASIAERHTKEQWEEIIKDIHLGKLNPIGEGSFKKIYRKGDKVYTFEDIKQNGGAIYEKFNKMDTTYVLTPLDMYECADRRYLELEYCKGDGDDETGNTMKLLEEFDEEELKVNFIGLEEAVKQLHALDVVALDIKPENMLIDCGSDKSIVLTDLDGAIVNKTGGEHLTPAFFYSFDLNEDKYENYKRNDLFALYITFIEVLNPGVEDVYGTSMFRFAMKSAFGIDAGLNTIVEDILGSDKIKYVELTKIYTEKLLQLKIGDLKESEKEEPEKRKEPEKKEEPNIVHRSVFDIFNAVPLTWPPSEELKF